MIANETIEQVKDKAAIAEIIGGYVPLKKKGAEFVGLCPFHSEKTPSFTVSPAKRIFKCFGCGKSGDVISFIIEHENKSYPEAISILAEKVGVTLEEEVKRKEFTKPPPRLEKLGSKSLAWFEGERKISNNTLLRFGITEATEWMPQFEKEVPVICFNYYRDDVLVNIKFRGPKKSFKMAKDAELIFYNLDAIKGETEVVITEGELDCLACHESGVYNAVSVPNGAGTGNLRLEYLDNCYAAFGDKEKIILATDNDHPGRRLRDELARRLGVGRCFQIVYPDGCKDLNDVLKMHGPDKVKGVLAAIQPWPIRGVLAMDDLFETVMDWYENGYPAGAKSRIEGFDNLLTFAPGQMTTVTGIPGHGKDEFSNWLMSNLARYENWSWGLFGFEETPAETVTKLAEKFSGKAFGWRKDPAHRMNRKEFEWAIGQIDLFFHFVATDEIETDIDSLLEIAAQLVIQKGIKGLYLNPWNWIEHARPAFQTETEYVGVALGKILKWAKKHQVHVILVAHTTKIAKDKDGKYMIPNLYSISGSANFFNKTFNGVCVYRNYETGVTDIYVQKVKQSWLGQVGFASYRFNTMTRQYEFLTSSVGEKRELPPQLDFPGTTWKPVQENNE